MVVNTIGDYTETYKFELPSGRNNLTPDISLAYSSQEKNYDSEVGFGWSLNVPVIERIVKIGTNDLYNRNDFSSSLDGELVMVSTSTFNPKTETGSFNKYEKSTSSWVVYDTLGTKYIFGSSSLERQDNPNDISKIFRWYISEIQDTNGNKIVFSYTKSNGKVYLSKIAYAHDSTGSGLYDVRISYSSTTPYVQNKTGFSVKNENLIDNVSVYFNNTLVTKYNLSYQLSSKSVFKLLTSVQKIGYNESGAATSQPARTFQYTDHLTTQIWVDDPDMATTVPKKLYSTVVYSGFNKSYYWRSNIQDLNGDGLADWVNEGNVYLNLGGSWQATSTWPALPVTEFNKENRLADLNGDGLSDIISSRKDYYSSTNIVTVKSIKMNQGDGTWVENAGWASTTPMELLYRNFSGSYSEYVSEVYIVDMNSDGLADWVYSGNVYLNNGVGWEPTPSWVLPVSSFKDRARLADVNSDGLPDIVNAYRKEFSPVWNPNTPIVDYAVYINQGDGTWVNNSAWASTIPSYLVFEYQNAPPANPLVSTYKYDRFITDVNGDNLADWVSDTSVYLNTGTGWEATSSLAFPVDADDLVKDYRLVDIDGDSQADIVRSFENSWFGTVTNSKNALISNAVPLWLLSTSTSEFGGTTAVIYGETTEKINNVQANPKNPFPQYVVKKIVRNPSIGQVASTTYEYMGGQLYFNSDNILGRKPAGFHAITETNSLGKLKTYYHQGNGNATTSSEQGDEPSKIGLVYRKELFDVNNNLYQTTINLYATSSVNASSTYVKLNQTTKLDYDGDSDHKDSAVSYTYNNSNGNISTRSEWGEVTANQDGTFTDVGTDKRVTTYTYASNTAAKISRTVAVERLNNQSGARVKESRYYYDSLALGLVNKGNVTKKEDWATSTTYINTRSTYNSFGLKTKDLDPRGNATNYVYDLYNLYPATTTNSLNHSTYYVYDYSSGKVKKTIDSNGFMHEVTYDGLDRLIEKREPLLDSYAMVTVEKYIYQDMSGKVSIQNRKYLNQFDSYDTYTYFDGLGRKIQERSEAESQNQYSVIDTGYGTNGLVNKKSLPYFATGAGRTNATNQNNLYTNYSYDVLGRQTSVGTVLGTATFVNDQWQETITDTANNKTKNQYDAYGRLINVKQILGTSTQTTTYLLSPHDQLTRITDPAGNLRNFTYDGLGRRTKAEDLHASADTTFGFWTYAYDAASNIATTTDPNSQITVNTYDALNRITSENSLSTAGIEATYTYDSCSGGIGKLCEQTNSQSVTQYDNYTPLGNIGLEIKNINGNYYYTGTNYDLQSNPVEVIYPGGDVVIRNYHNGAGQLERIELQNTSGTTSDIISDFDYGPHGMITEQLFGNGVLTIRTYDENELYRLRNITTFSSSTPVMPNVGGPGIEFLDIQNSVDLAILQGNSLPITSESTTTLSEIVSSSIESALVSDIGTEAAGYLIENVASTDQASTDTSLVATLGTSTDLGSYQTVLQTGDVQSNEYAEYLDELLPVSSALIASSAPAEWSEGNLAAKKIFKDTVSERLKKLKTDISLSSDFVETATGFNLVPKKTQDRQLVVSAEKLLPSVTLKEEVGDNGLSVQYRDGFIVATSSIFESKFLRWENLSGNKEVNAYPLDPRPGMEFGGLEIEVVLSDRLETNTFNFAVASNQRYEFVYQPLLTEEEIQSGKKRPEDVLGSYEVFNNGSKFLHIYRPKAHDAAGNEVWGTLVYTAGNLEVVIPQEFLDAATYPVVVDPTFGNTNASYSSFNFVQHFTFNQEPVLSEYQTGIAFAATSSGPLTSVTTFLQFYNAVGDVSLEAMVYEKDAYGTSSHRLVGTSVRHDVGAESPYGYQYHFAWVTFNFATGTIQSGKEYILAITGDADTLHCSPVDPDTCTVAICAENVGGTGIYFDSLEFGNVPDPWVQTVDTEFTLKFSMYASYESLATTTTMIPSGAVIQNLSYTYDSVGNITKIVDRGLGTAATTSFTYDSLYRVTRASTTQAQSNPYVETYTYNSLGNLTNKTGAGAYLYQGNTGSLYANPHAPTSINGVTYNYDRNGNLASTTGGAVNIWDYKNRLLATKNGSATTTYTYDVNGQRVSKTIGGVTTRYPSSYLETTGATTTAHIYAGNQLVASIVTVGATTPKTYYTHPDHLGSTNVVTDSIGTTTSRYTYYPYGAVRNSFGTTTFNQPNQYIGQDRDEQADLSYLGARYYRANTGQFLSQDPVSWEIGQTPDGTRVLLDPQLQNSYSYGRGNPVLHKDPEGRIPLIPLALAALALYDAYDTYQTVTNPNQNLTSKGVAVAMLASPLGDFKAAGKGVKTLYHYTSDKGLEGILKSNQLNPSLKANNPLDARFGDGQYLSDIKPGTMTNAELSSKFITLPFQGNKFKNYIELDVSTLKLIHGRNGVYLNPSGQPLDINGLIKNYGKNEK